ncbi:MAG: hypothetical protein IKA02_02120 [Clostridia bacterium]|nr:hypothetical protein [Clostridia bacterium]
MKIRQIRILDAEEFTNTYFSFETYCNEIIENLYRDADISDIKIEYAAPTCIVISFDKYIDIKKEEI